MVGYNLAKHFLCKHKTCTKRRNEVATWEISSRLLVQVFKSQLVHQLKALNMIAFELFSYAPRSCMRLILCDAGLFLSFLFEATQKTSLVASKVFIRTGRQEFGMQNRNSARLDVQQERSFEVVLDRIEAAHDAIEEFEDAILLAEAKRRLAEIKSGKVKMLSHAELVAKVRRMK